MKNNITDASATTKVGDSQLPAVAGLRMTRQRKVVYNVLMNHRDHPSAGEVYERAKRKMPSI